MSQEAADEPAEQTGWPSRPAGCVHCRTGGWAAGADAVQPANRAGRAGVVPAGRLHAVADDGVLTGRARCGAPVALLDPSVFGWPDAGTAQWPLCWTCLALTR